MYLFFDTETTGLPRNWKASISDTNNWPRLVQVAWLIFDLDGNRVGGQEYLIKPEGYIIPEDASRIHGITTFTAMERGKELLNVLGEFNNEIDNASILVAHNYSFDSKIIQAEMFRMGIKTSLQYKKSICTMESSTNFCQIPGKVGYKWPKLSDLHIKLFGRDFEEAHSAIIDIEATARCFWRLKELKII